VRDQLNAALNKGRGRADYIEIRFETEDYTNLGYRGRELDSVGTGRFAGGIVRACTNAGWGIAGFDRLDDLDRAMAQACESASLMAREGEQTHLAEAPAADDDDRPAHLVRDFRGVSLDDKLKLTREYNEAILAEDPAIETSNVSYSDRLRTVCFASTRGASFQEERPNVTLALSAVARKGDLVQRAFKSFASVSTYGVAENRHADARAIARRAADLLKAPSVEGGKYDVVLDPELAGVFAHEAFGHLSEADFLYENPKMRDLMHLGRKMGVEDLNIVDDGTIHDSVGSLAFDDEGTPTQKTYLIKKGVLSAHLHSLETAGKMGERPTGNARALSRTFHPIVRMTNTYIEPGNKSFEDLISGIDDGLYCCNCFGGQTMMEMFTFSSAYAYRIRNGKVGELVRDAVLTGNVFDTLYSIDGFGSDLLIPQRGGGCGKGAQSPLPVTCGAPHIRVRNVVIGGKGGK
jgi:TldD protein